MNVRLKKQPTAKQKSMIHNACKEVFLGNLKHYNYDAAIQVIHILHFEFGFGQKRLERFAELLCKMQTEQRKRYELTEEDTPWLCEKQLQEDGINVQKLLKE